MVINPAAVRDRKGRKVVFLIKEDRVVEKEIKTGEVLGDMVEVPDGLTAGDRLVINPPDTLKDRDRIALAG